MEKDDKGSTLIRIGVSGESSFWYRPTRVVPDQRPLNGRRRPLIVYVYSGQQKFVTLKQKRKQLKTYFVSQVFNDQRLDLLVFTAYVYWCKQTRRGSDCALHQRRSIAS